MQIMANKGSYRKLDTDANPGIGNNMEYWNVDFISAMESGFPVEAGKPIIVSFRDTVYI
jgi:hypothetical protein